MRGFGKKKIYIYIYYITYNKYTIIISMPHATNCCTVWPIPAIPALQFLLQTAGMTGESCGQDPAHSSKLMQSRAGPLKRSHPILSELVTSSECICTSSDQKGLCQDMQTMFVLSPFTVLVEWAFVDVNRQVNRFFVPEHRPSSWGHRCPRVTGPKSHTMTSKSWRKKRAGVGWTSRKGEQSGL